MKKYVVNIPITGYVSVEVEAENEDEARTAAWSKIDDGVDDDDVTWEYCEAVTEGNVTYAMLNEVEVTEVKARTRKP